MTEQQAMRMALEALEKDELHMIPDEKGHMVFVKEKAINALRQALEQQPADEPVAWMWYVNNGAGYVSRGMGFHQTNIPFAKHTPLYTRPQPAAWVSLTDEETTELIGNVADIGLANRIARAIEAALRSKNT